MADLNDIHRDLGEIKKGQEDLKEVLLDHVKKCREERKEHEKRISILESFRSRAYGALAVVTAGWVVLWKYLSE